MALLLRENPTHSDQAAAGPWRVGPLAGLLLAICACVGVRAYMIHHAEVISRDGAIYIQMAREWPGDSRGVIRNYDYHVGYSAAIAWLHRALVGGGMRESMASWELAACLVSLLSSVVALVALWVFTGLTFNWPIACITALLFCFPCKWAELGADVRSDALAVALQMWAATLSLVALSLLRKGSGWSMALAGAVGVCAGMGYLVRPESLLMAALAIGLWLGWQLFDQRLRWRLTLGSVAAASLATTACALPYMLAIGTLTKKKHLSDIVIGPQGLLPLAMVHFSDTSFYQLGNQLISAMHPVLFTLAMLWLLAWGAFRILTLGKHRPFTPEPRAREGSSWWRRPSPSSSFPSGCTPISTTSNSGT